MRMKRYSPLFSLALLVTMIAGVFACAWYDERDFYYSFFAPETSRSDRDAPFFRSFHLLYTGYTKDDNVADFSEVNIREWDAWLQSSIPKSELTYVLYRASKGEVDSLAAFTSGSLPTLAGTDSVMAIVKHGSQPAVRSFLSYLVYAKQCEPYVTYIAYWTWDSSLYKSDPRKNRKTMERITQAGIGHLASIKDPFLRERYHFQILRMLFHQGKYEDCSTYFRRYRTELSPDRSMHDRCLGYAAGALYRLKRYAEANYFYSLLYDRSETMRTDAFLCFHPQDERDWKNCLALARTPRERTVLWQLLGIYADPLRAMKEIHAIDPASEMLDLLLVRAVNLAEEAFMPDRSEIAGDASTGYALKKSSIDPGLLDFVTRVAHNDKTHKPYLWNLAAGYLLTMRGDYPGASGFLSDARRAAAGDTLVQEQAYVTDIIRKVESQRQLDASFEAEIVKDLKWLGDSGRARGLRNDFVLDWSLKRLSEKYMQDGARVKAQCLYRYSDQAFYENDAKQARMIAYMDKSDKTEFDRYLLSIHPYTRSDIFELQAVTLFYEGKLEEAIMKFREQPGSGDRMLPGDPFLIHINDCHDCDHQAPQTRTYSKLNFVERMLELERLASQPGENSSQYFFLLANGYYNATFFGNARVLYQTNIGEYYYIDLYNPDPAYRTDRRMDCSKAEQYYMHAGERTRDREFRAKCMFMAAKCEQNRFYLHKPAEYNGDFRAGKYFARLRKDYANTRYYKHVIKECGYFRTYVSINKSRKK